jgi:tripartite-type tricarboxylate transporter receptor subunit TctC
MRGRICAAFIVCGVCSAESALAQSYPVRPIRLVVASSPGGSSDVLARLVAPKLGEALGQQVVVENRAGASGIIGVEVVAKSAPDGYTLILTQTSLAINPAMFAKVPYDALRDLAPITEMVTTGSLLVVHRSVPAHTVRDLIALAKSKPGQLVIGSSGSGTQPHLAAELFKMLAKVDMPQVLFKGAGHAVISLITGEVAVQFPNPPTVIEHIKSGKVRALGVTTAKRMRSMPDVPTIAEAALPGYEAAQWFGILARAGTPRPVIERLNQETNRILNLPEMKDRLFNIGMDVRGTTPEEFAQRVASETKKWAIVIKNAGLKPE